MEKGSFEAAKGINPRELSLEAMKGQASLTPLKRKDPTGVPSHLGDLLMSYFVVFILSIASVLSSCLHAYLPCFFCLFVKQQYSILNVG